MSRIERLRPGERYEPMLGQIFYSAAWLNGPEMNHQPYEVMLLVRSLPNGNQSYRVVSLRVLAQTP